MQGSEQALILFIRIRILPKVYSDLSLDPCRQGEVPVPISQNRYEFSLVDVLRQLSRYDRCFISYAAFTFIRSFGVVRRANENNELAIEYTLLHKDSFVSTWRQIPAIQDYSYAAFRLEFRR